MSEPVLPPELAELSALLLGPRTRHRSVTLWSTEWRGEVPGRAHGLGRCGTPVHHLFAGESYARWYEAAEGQMPRVVHARRHEPGDLALPHACAEIDVAVVWSLLFGLPFGGLVAGLLLEYEDRRSPAQARAIPALFEDVDRRRDELAFGSSEPVKLIDVCRDGHREATDGLRLGGDMHHVTCLAPAVVGDTLAPDAHRLQRLVSRRDAPSRSGFLTARLPAEANRYPDAVAALTPGATVLGGQEAVLELAIVLSAVQALAALAALRQIQRRAFAALGELRAPGSESSQRSWLEARSEELRDLEVDLSFGVEAYLDMRILVPSLPVEQFHSELVDALAIERGARVSGAMLTRLAAAIDAEETALGLVERDRADRWRAAAGTLGAVAIALSLLLSFMGINATEVDGRRSLFDAGHYWPYWLALALLVAGTAGVGWTYARRRQLAPD